MRNRNSPAVWLLTQEEHLDLVALQHFVSLELILNFLVPHLPLLLLCAHTATHLDGFFIRRMWKNLGSGRKFVMARCGRRSTVRMGGLKRNC